MFSRIKSMGKVNFPAFRKAMLYMYRFDLANPALPEGFEDFDTIFKDMVEKSGLKTGHAHITIDSRLVLKGKSHRLPGPHVDGNYNGTWGGGGWLLQDKTKKLSKEDHEKFYCSPLGGMLIASNSSGCQAWKGRFDFTPEDGGSCLNFRAQIAKLKTFLLKPNEVYITNSTCIHESVPVTETVRRTLVRITLPPVKVL